MTQPRSRRGLLDFLLLLGLGWGVYASTPIGAVAETAIRVARGQSDYPSWFATFRGRDTAAAAPTAATTTAVVEQWQQALPAPVVAAAATHGIDVDALAALVAARGSCTVSGCTVRAPDRLAMFAPGAVGDVPVDVVARGLKEARVALANASNELAIEALFVGTPALTLAVEQARRSGLTAVDDVEVHAPFLSPGQRRGPLQGALAVLLAHRLRTLAWPADGFRVTSPFGERVHPVTGKVSFHNGTDVGTPTGTPLKSAHAGAIKRASVDSISGNYVVIDHGLGLQTTYCHLSAVDVHEQQRVVREEIVGRSGSTGRVTGPHLHYILRVNSTPVDAERYGHAASLAPVAETPKPP